MILNNDVKLETLITLIGKEAYYRAPRGRSLPHIIEAIELTVNGVVFVLKRKHSAVRHRSRPDHVDLAKEKTTYTIIPKRAKDTSRCLKCGARKKENAPKCLYCNTIDPELIKKATDVTENVSDTPKPTV